MSAARVFALSSMFALAIGCASNDATPPTPKADQRIISDLGTSPDLAAACGEGIYPCGPYGTREGEVISNELFLGFTDPDNFCKLAKDCVLDLSNKTSIAFHDWYRPPANCPDKPKKLLWIMVSAGWCGPCVTEIREVMAEIDSGALDPRVTMLDILFEDDKHEPATEAFAKIWATNLGIKFPLVLDPSFKMGKYFAREAVPFNMLIDLRTMKVFYSQTGSNMPAIGQQVRAFLDTL